ncbi:HalOD1 output domain-containing protein [Halomarina ordinaria]|uniref:HalOD1 output domain-containing protein n=1 Tax=Halomarina ordinaria TaxID=3033939 RepID=A0ABD5U8N2_9EURY|nr:HalOD1 output domain-containing protein [Halomarina sp. PSRA2]
MAVRTMEQIGGTDGTNAVAGQATVDWESADPIVDALVDALVEATDSDPAELDPLFEYVDPDALTALFAPQSGVQLPAVTAVRFAYGDYAVVVQQDGDVVVREQ